MSWLVASNELTEDQKKVVEMPMDSDILVTGSPGSGKTLMMLHRARYLMDRYKIAPDRVRLFVYTNALSSYIKEGFQELRIPEECVMTFDAWCKKFVGDRGEDGDFARIRETAWKLTRSVGNSKYCLVGVDEGQDFDVRDYETITSIARYVTVFMDEKQKIYDKRDANEDSVENVFRQKVSVGSALNKVVGVVAPVLQMAEFKRSLDEIRDSDSELKKMIQCANALHDYIYKKPNGIYILGKLVTEFDEWHRDFFEHGNLRSIDGIIPVAKYLKQLYDERYANVGKFRKRISMGAFRCSPFVVNMAIPFIREDKERRKFLSEHTPDERGERRKPLMRLVQSEENDMEALRDQLQTRLDSQPDERIVILFPRNDLKHDYGRALLEEGMAVEIHYSSSESDKKREAGSPPEADFGNRRPKLITYSSAKGLTFDSVFLPCQHEMLRGRRSLRWLFVGITRATRWCYLSGVKGEIAFMDKFRRLELNGHLHIQEWSGEPQVEVDAVDESGGEGDLSDFI